MEVSRRDRTLTWEAREDGCEDPESLLNRKRSKMCLREFWDCSLYL